MSNRDVFTSVAQALLGSGVATGLASLTLDPPLATFLQWLGIGIFLAGGILYAWLFIKPRKITPSNEREFSDKPEISVGHGSEVKSRGFSSESGRRFIEGGDRTKIDEKGTKLTRPKK